MKIFPWFQSKASATTRAITMMLPLGTPPMPRINYKALAEEGYSGNTVVFACIREIAEACAGVEWGVYKKIPDRRRERIHDHPVLELLRKPNPFQGRFELFESAVSYLYLSGNMYMESVDSGSGRDNPTPPHELYILRPDRIKILPHPVHRVGGYEYEVGGRKQKFSSKQILHLKLFNPLSDWYGLSPVQVASLAIDKLNQGDRWNAALLQNSAVPSGALVTKQRLSDEQFRRLREEMREQLQGIRHAREPLLLEQDLDWKELGVSPKDMDWIEGLKLSATQIAQVFNVPPELVGLQEATYQNRKEARKALYTEVVCPVLNRLRDGLNQWLVPRYGTEWRLEYDRDSIPALAEDQESLWNRANESSFLTINEKRRLVGYGEIPGGDSLNIRDAGSGKDLHTHEK